MAAQNAQEPGSAVRIERDAGAENWDRYENILSPALVAFQSGHVDDAARAFIHVASIRAHDEPVVDVLGHLLSLVRYLRNTSRRAEAELAAREALALADAGSNGPDPDVLYAARRLQGVVNPYQAVEVGERILALCAALSGVPSLAFGVELLNFSTRLAFARKPHNEVAATIRWSIAVLEQCVHGDSTPAGAAHMRLSRVLYEKDLDEALLEAERSIDAFLRGGSREEHKEIWIQRRFINEHRAGARGRLTIRHPK